MISPELYDDDAADPARLDRPPVRQGVAERAMAELLAALTVLTRLPVRYGSGERTGASAYVLVGALIGSVASVPLGALGAAVPPVAAVLAIASVAVVSGVIHLDGLADTADALIAMGPDGAERARRDPAVGVGGITALILVLGIEVVSLALLAAEASPAFAGVACVVAAGVSRGVPVVLVRLARARARTGGLGGWFAARATNTAAAIVLGSAALLGLAGAAALGTPAVFVAGGIGGIGGVALGMGLVRLRGQLDGDLLGASVELSFALALVAAAVIAGGTVG